MCVNRLEVHNNTMVKYTTYLAHTQYIYTVMLKCINVQMYKKNGDNPNTYRWKRVKTSHKQNVQETLITVSKQTGK